MATRDEFLRLLWDELINASLHSDWIDNTIRASERDAESPFADAGFALKRLRNAGVSEGDLKLVARLAAYEAVFGVLYKLEDPGVDDGAMLFEELLTADPSGFDGRPGSADGKPGDVPGA